MNILVTGGAGFIASQIADAYIAQGHTVTIMDDLSSGKKANVNQKASFHRMDVRDPNIVTVFEKGKFDVVNHHAAQIDVRRSMEDPFFDASVNILGTLRLLECARSYAVKKFIFASSGGVMYGECPNGPADEETPALPVSPYGFSKQAAEVYVRFYGTTFGLNSTVLRYGNVYGPRQDPHGEAGVVAIFCGRVKAGEGVKIFGNGEQVRDYVYVGDVVQANISALSAGNGETINIGTGVATSVNALYKAIAKLAPKAPKEPAYAAARAGELQRSLLDAQRAGRVLNWKPNFSLDQGLTETYRFFEKQ